MRAAVQGKNSTRIKRIPTNTDRTKALDNKQEQERKLNFTHNCYDQAWTAFLSKTCKLLE